jgi:hypothetical protein
MYNDEPKLGGVMNGESPRMGGRAADRVEEGPHWGYRINVPISGRFIRGEDHG